MVVARQKNYAKFKSRAVFVALLLAVSNCAFAWGEKGHQVIALIAWEYLSPATRNAIDNLLKDDHSALTSIDFASEATWADAYRDADRDNHHDDNRDADKNRYEQTRRWHYVNLNLDHPDFNRACFSSPLLPANQRASDGPAKACVTDKILQFSAELKAKKTSREERLLALQFLIHLVGDLHQPLHASDHDDGGGNDVRISAKGFKRGTLHSYWDNSLVTRLGRKPETIARKLIAQIDRHQAERWRQGTPRDWTLESFAVARDIAYAQLQHPTQDIYILDENYSDTAKAAAAQQLMKAGVRLAWLLEQSSLSAY